MFVRNVRVAVHAVANIPTPAQETPDRLNLNSKVRPHASDPTRIVQTGSQRTNGYEIGLSGSITRKWRVAGGYAYQDASVTNATASAR